MGQPIRFRPTRKYPAYCSVEGMIPAWHEKTSEDIKYEVIYNPHLNIGQRFNNGKPRWALVDFQALEPMVRVLEYGCKKYDADNWKKGLYTRGITESMLRHTFALLRGELNDEESGLPHIGHIMANAMFISHMIEQKPNFNDLNK